VNTSKLRVAAAVAIASAATLMLAQSAVAGPAPQVAPHRHFLLTPAGAVPVGPQVCEHPDLQAAFNQFHAAVHVGPANTAFDHTHNPVDIRAAAC
jgi:hypothetical protein